MSKEKIEELQKSMENDVSEAKKIEVGNIFNFITKFRIL